MGGRSGGGAGSSEGGGTAGGLTSCPVGDCEAAASTLFSPGGGMLLLSSLGVQLLLGELFSLGGSGGGESISDTKDGGSDEGAVAG